MNKNKASGVESMSQTLLLISFCNQLSSPYHSLCILDPISGDSNWIDMSEIPEVLRQELSGITGICGISSGVVIATQGTLPALAYVNIIDAKITSYIALERTIDTHSLVFHDGYVYLVSTGTNEIYRVSFFDGQFGKEELFWSYPSVSYGKDEVHLNGLTVDEGRFIASCFGHRRADGSWGTEGEVFYVDSGRPICEGLNQPHSPFVADKRLIFAESAAKNIHVYNKNEHDEWVIKNVAHLKGYARGVIIKGESVFVGISAKRTVSRSRRQLLGSSQGENTGSAIVEINYETGMQVANFDLTGFGQEVYDIVEVDTSHAMKSMNEVICTRINEMESKVKTYALDVDRLFTEVNEKNKIINELVKDKLMHNPKVSIVIPVYNGSNFLESAIESAINQTHQNIEVIVVNDGSTDNGKTKEIAEKYLGKIRYFEKPNGGVATALNLGISHMTGDYFAWLSHDDIYHPDKIQKSINAISRETSRCIVFTDFVMDNLTTNTQSFSQLKKSIPGILSPNEEEYQYALIKAFFESKIHLCSTLIPSHAFKEIGHFDEQLITTQDYDFLLRLAKANYRFILLDEPLITTRHHNLQGTTTNLALHILELEPLYLSVYENFKQTLKDLPLRLYFSFVDIMYKRGLETICFHMLNNIAPFHNESEAPVWLYWENREGKKTPEYIYLCWYSIIMRNRRDFAITIVTPKTLPNYLPNLNNKYLGFSEIAHRADYIRFNLLREYGGIWLDSDFISFRSLNPIKQLIDEKGFVCTSYKQETGMMFPIISFLAAQKNNAIVCKMVESIEHFIEGPLSLDGRQPSWDEIGGNVLQNILMDEKRYISIDIKYFYPVPTYYSNQIVQDDGKKIDFEDLAYGQNISNSAFGENISMLTKEKLYNPLTCLGSALQIGLSDLPLTLVAQYGNSSNISESPSETKLTITGTDRSILSSISKVIISLRTQGVRVTWRRIFQKLGL